MAIEIVDLQYPLKTVIFHSFVSLPEGMALFFCSLACPISDAEQASEFSAGHIIQLISIYEMTKVNNRRGGMLLR